MKELELTEGRSTGIPTIQEKLAENGSPRATFETTDDRLTFLIHIPVHPGCDNSLTGFSSLKEPSSEKNGPGSEKSSEKTGFSSEKSSEKTDNINLAILGLISDNNRASASDMAIQLGVSSRAVEKRIRILREYGVIRRVGPDRGGYWEIVLKK